MGDREATEENGCAYDRSSSDAREATPRLTVAARVQRYREELGNVVPYGKSARDLVASQQKLLLMLQDMQYAICQLDKEMTYVHADLHQPRMSQNICDQVRREEAARLGRQDEVVSYLEEPIFLRRDTFSYRPDPAPPRVDLGPRIDFRPISLLSERRELDGSAYSLTRERDSVTSGDSRWSADLYRAGSATSSGHVRLSRSESVSSVSTWHSDDASSACADSEDDERRWVAPPRDPTKKPLEIKM